jgi:hypothetical protein
LSVYSEEFEGKKAGLYPELFSALTNPTSPQAWLQLALHVWDIEKLDKLKTTISGRLETRCLELIKTLENLKYKSMDALVKLAFDETRAFMKFEVEEQAEMLKTGKDFPMTSSIARLGWNLEQYLKLYDAYKSCVINIPTEYGLLIPAERYWRKYYARGRPGFRDAFIMWRKDLVGSDLPLSILTEDIGMPEDLARRFIAHAFYDPSPMELWRLARTISLPQSYIDRKLKNAGLDDVDREIYKKAILKEVIKEELRTVNALLLEEYELGTLRKDEFQKWLKAWEFSDDEIALMLLAGDIRKSKFVLKLKRDAQIYLFRKQKIDAKTLEQRLIDLGIDPAVANAVVENECARQGIEWTEGK